MARLFWTAVFAEAKLDTPAKTPSSIAASTALGAVDCCATRRRTFKHISRVGELVSDDIAEPEEPRLIVFGGSSEHSSFAVSSFARAAMRSFSAAICR